MKRIAQGTLLFIMVALVSLAATLLAARATQMSQLLTEEPSAVAAGSVSELETGVSTLSARGFRTGCRSTGRCAKR